MPPEGDASSASPARLARLLAGPLSAVTFVAVATAARVWLGHLFPGLTVFSLYYPAILGAALIGGEAAAALALTLAAGSSWIFLRHAYGALTPATAITLNLMIFAFAGAFVGAVGAQLRRLLRRRRRDIRRLAEREARYRALFEGVTEGFALIEGIWDEHGSLRDVVIVEANPPLLEMFKAVAPLVGRRHSEFPGLTETEYLAACERAFRGPPVRQEIYLRNSQRWFDVRMSRIGDNKVAQIIVDVTEAKAAESRRTEMFNELNHRVKNNLAAVSALLTMQARVADDPRVREQLDKAVDRIEAISEVHASLYRASSTDRVDFAGYLQRLCDRLSTSLVDGERVRIEVDADPAMAPLEEAVALGMIVNELVTNAAKYAYPAPESGVIRVALRNRPGELVLQVCDEGRGLPEGQSNSGIGMRLVRSLVQQCQGELQIEQDHGARFIIRLREHGRPDADAAQSRLL